MIIFSAYYNAGSNGNNMWGKQIVCKTSSRSSIVGWT